MLIKIFIKYKVGTLIHNIVAYLNYLKCIIIYII